jgi:hypothetical protein
MGAIQQIFKTHKECVAFQDEVGKFIVEAIREKIERLPQKEISDEEIDKVMQPMSGMHEFYKGGFIEGAKWYGEQLKQRQLKQRQ